MTDVSDIQPITIQQLAVDPQEEEQQTTQLYDEQAAEQSTVQLSTVQATTQLNTQQSIAIDNNTQININDVAADAEPADEVYYTPHLSWVYTEADGDKCGTVGSIKNGDPLPQPLQEYVHPIHGVISTKNTSELE
jgi:hypothetical protein